MFGKKIFRKKEDRKAKEYKIINENVAVPEIHTEEADGAVCAAASSGKPFAAVLNIFLNLFCIFVLKYVKKTAVCNRTVYIIA